MHRSSHASSGGRLCRGKATLFPPSTTLLRALRCQSTKFCGQIETRNLGNTSCAPSCLCPSLFLYWVGTHNVRPPVHACTRVCLCVSWPCAFGHAHCSVGQHARSAADAPRSARWCTRHARAQAGVQHTTRAARLQTFWSASVVQAHAMHTRAAQGIGVRCRRVSWHVHANPRVAWGASRVRGPPPTHPFFNSAYAFLRLDNNDSMSPSLASRKFV